MPFVASRLTPFTPSSNITGLGTIDLWHEFHIRKAVFKASGGRFSEHVNVATNYSNLALIYKDLGDFEQAKEYQQRALDIQLDKLGPEHVNVATNYSNLALIYKDLGDFEQAKEYRQRALAIKADKHWLNKTPNEVHEGLLTEAKNFMIKIIFLLDRFYAVFKVYRVGVVLKFKRLNFAGFLITAA